MYIFVCAHICTCVSRDHTATFCVSVENGRNLASLNRAVVDSAVHREWDYPSHQRSSLSQEDQCEEMVREKVFQRLNKEMPYEIEHSVDPWYKNPESDELRITHRCGCACVHVHM
jgi:GTPase Era involved in 16S rRNA processing